MKSNHFSYPKVKSVQAKDHKILHITFLNNVQKEYDCTPLLKEKAFSLLTEEPFFRLVKVDAGGYGVSWNDDIDLSESELWLNGQEVS